MADKVLRIGGRLLKIGGAIERGKAGAPSLPKGAAGGSPSCAPVNPLGTRTPPAGRYIAPPKVVRTETFTPCK